MFTLFSVLRIVSIMQVYDTIYLLTAMVLTAGGSSTVHIYTQQYIEQYN